MTADRSQLKEAMEKFAEHKDQLIRQRDHFITENLKLCNEVRLLNNALRRKNKYIQRLKREKALAELARIAQEDGDYDK